MQSIPTMLTVCIYALILGLFFLFSTLACFLFRKYVMHAKVAAKLTDPEANAADIVDNFTSFPDKSRGRPLTYPAAARKSPRCLPSSKRVISNPFVSRRSNKLPAAINTTILEVKADGIDGGRNNDGNHSDNWQDTYDDYDRQQTPLPLACTDMATDPNPTRPCRPPQHMLLDVLARFPYEQEVAQDIWFPLPNSETGRWELGVIKGSHRVSLYPHQDDINRACSVVVVAPEEMEDEEDKTGTIMAFSIDKDEIDYTPLTPSNTLVDIVVKKSKKRDSSRKKKHGRPRVESPELYVNARPYEEIEAEEVRAVALAAKVESDERNNVDTEEEALSVILSALAVRNTREPSNAKKFGSSKFDSWLLPPATILY